MSDAIKCERCGKYEDKKEHNFTVSIKKTSRSGNYFSPQDICESCSKELEGWFKIK